MDSHSMFSNLDIVENIVSCLPLMDKVAIQSLSSVFTTAVQTNFKKTNTLMITDTKGLSPCCLSFCHGGHIVYKPNVLNCLIKDQAKVYDKLKKVINMMPKLEVVYMIANKKKDYLRRVRVMILKNNLDKRTLKCFYFQGYALDPIIVMGPLHQPTSFPTRDGHLPKSND